MATQRKMTRKTKSEVGYLAPVKEVRSDAYGFNQYQLTDTQKQFANKILENDMVVCSAPSGTGKTLATLHTFVKFYLQDRTKQIIVVRTPVEAGMDKIGFLPNDLNSKLEPHFASAKVLLTKLLNKGKVETDMDHRIHFKIPNYLLGSTLDNTLLLIDESQDTKKELKTKKLTLLLLKYEIYLFLQLLPWYFLFYVSVLQADAQRPRATSSLGLN